MPAPSSFVAVPSAPLGRPRFVGALADLVAVGLHRPALSALLADAEVIPAPQVDRTYLLDVLGEEIARPFGHPLRPVVELVLNAADALAGGPRGAEIDVTAEDGRVTVTDRGEGMSLYAVLARLLLPFATDRVPGVHQGRFGVGFFSALGFGPMHPPSFSLRVETGDGGSGHLLAITARGPEASDLSAVVHEIAPRRGTRVTLCSALLDGAAVRAYLADALHFFPPERAVVRAEGVPLNDGAMVSGGQLFEEEVAPGLSARFHLGGRGLAAGITAALYHAGVKVRPCYAIGELALVDFPGVVELTEGRDALKPGPAFAAVAEAFHRRLARLGEEPGTPEEVRLRIAELSAQISALMLDSAGFREAAPELCRALVGKGRHLVSPERVEGLLGFLGPGVTDRLFVPESFWAAREWQPYLPGERELLLDELRLEPPERLASLSRKRPDLPGLAALASRAADGVLVALARGARPPGPLPCLGTREAVLVRADAPAVAAPRGWADRYALRAAFDRALGVREADVERDLIVVTPLVGGGR